MSDLYAQTYRHPKTKAVPDDGAYLDVSHPVIVEVRAGRETFTTHAALVRFFAAVDAPMRVQRTGRRETLVAHGAHVGLFTCKNRWVFRENVR